MGTILNRAIETTKAIDELEAQLERLRVKRAIDFATLTTGVSEDESDQLSPARVGAAVGLSRQNVDKAVKTMGPGTPRARAVERAAGAR